MYRYIVLRWRQTHNHDCFLQVIHTCITLLQYTLENNFSLIVKQSQAVNCLCKSRYILPQKLLPGKKKKISYFLCFPEYILPFLMINISTDICCSCLLQKLIENRVLSMQIISMCLLIATMNKFLQNTCQKLSCFLISS